MKKRGALICCCQEAYTNCEMKCPKGRKLNPDGVWRVEGWRYLPLSRRKR